MSCSSEGSRGGWGADTLAKEPSEGGPPGASGINPAAQLPFDIILFSLFFFLILFLLSVFQDGVILTLLTSKLRGRNF